MKKRKNSFLVWLLAAVLAIGMLPASALPSFTDNVNVSTGAELKAALEAAGDKTVKLTADVVYDDGIAVNGDKTLELNGHKIELKNTGEILVPAGADLKVDGSKDGSEIKSLNWSTFSMKDGSLTIDGGRYMVFGDAASVVFIGELTTGGKVLIKGGYFRSVKGEAIRSESKQDLDPPEVVIEDGTFISDENGA